MKIFTGDLVSEKKTYAVIVSRFNDFITGKLLEGALDTLKRHNVKDDEISVIWVPGAFEIPVMTQKIASLKKYDSIICLGALIRGQTPHFDYISSEVTKGIAHVSLQFMVPITYGLITSDTLEQAIERAGTKAGNKGADAAKSAIEMTNLFAQDY